MSTTVGAVVVGRSGARLSRTLGALRHCDVTMVVTPALDSRVANWLTALAVARRWTVLTVDDPRPGVLLNAGFDAAHASEWLFVLDAGDALTSGLLRVEALVAGVDDSVGFLAGAVRPTALGVEEVVHPENVNATHGFDPANPALRGICWRRESVVAAGGFDIGLPAALRYDMWLRLVGAGITGATTSDTLVDVGVARGDACREELESPDYAAAVRTVLERHHKRLAPSPGPVLEERERRLARLKTQHFKAVARRNRVIAHRRAADRINVALPVDPPADSDALPRRPSPRSRDWGYDRGGPLDRVFIEQFIAAEAAHVTGSVLEVQEGDYTRRFGTSVTRGDVVDVDEANREATIIADLRAAANIPSSTYDCVILTQTVHVIDDMKAVVAECHRILRPGGVVLATLPCVSRVCLEYGPNGDFWRVTPAGARCLFETVFGADVSISTYGNALATSAFVLGLGQLEVREGETAVVDPYNPTLVGVRSVKPGGAKAPAISSARRGEGAVLLYHRVGGVGPDPHRINLHSDTFERQAAWLASECSVLPLGELIDRSAARTLPSRALAITFDDGYLDTLTNATPLLRRYGLPATCFVATENLDDTHVFWWDRLSTLLLGDGRRPDALSLSLPDGPLDVPTTTPGERIFAHGLVYHAIAALPASGRDALLAQLTAWAPDARVDSGCRRMSADELRALARAGVAIGAHTVSHPHLPRLDPDSQQREIAESRRTLERIICVPVTHLAYPFGSVDATTVAAAQRAGISHALTCEPRALVPGDTPLLLPRLDPQEPRFDRFVARVLHAVTDETPRAHHVRSV